MSDNKIKIEFHVPWVMLWYVGMLFAFGIILADPITKGISGNDLLKLFVVDIVGWPLIVGLFVGTIAFKLAGIVK
jgi:hypothetical protein